MTFFDTFSNKKCLRLCIYNNLQVFLKLNSHELSSKELDAVKGVYEYPVWSPVSIGPWIDLFHYRTEQQAKQICLFEKNYLNIVYGISITAIRWQHDHLSWGLADTTCLATAFEEILQKADLQQTISHAPPFLEKSFFLCSPFKIIFTMF